jgi:hypothetical protein
MALDAKTHFTVIAASDRVFFGIVIIADTSTRVAFPDTIVAHIAAADRPLGNAPFAILLVTFLARVGLLVGTALEICFLTFGARGVIVLVIRYTASALLVGTRMFIITTFLQ